MRTIVFLAHKRDLNFFLGVTGLVALKLELKLELRLEGWLSFSLKDMRE